MDKERETLYSHLYSLVKIFLMDQITLSPLSRNPSPENIRILILNVRSLQNIESTIENKIFREEIKTHPEINREFWKHTSTLSRLKDYEEEGI